MSRRLPERPNLEQLKKQAKDLLRAVRAGSPEALKRIGAPAPKTFALHLAQRIIAKEYGFESWEALRREVEQNRALSNLPNWRQVADAGFGKPLQQRTPGTLPVCAGYWPMIPN
jgi:hypothetical protein